MVNLTLQILDNIGKTKTQNLIDDIQSNYRELFEKKYPKYFDNNYAKACSLVSITEEKEIKQIGISKVDDLLSDNFGKFLGAIMSNGDCTMNDNAGTSRGYGIYGSPKFNDTNINLPQTKGSNVQIGKGTTQATRQDWSIETPFIVAPESVANTIGNAGWISGFGKVQIPTVIIAGGSGGISETVLQFSCRPASLNGSATHVFSRDNISPIVNFIAGQTINVDYGIFLS